MKHKHHLKHYLRTWSTEGDRRADLWLNPLVQLDVYIRSNQVRSYPGIVFVKLELAIVARLTNALLL